jgi:subtilisin family serine protease
VFFEPRLHPCTASGPLAHAGHSTSVAGAMAAFVPDDPSNTTLPPPGVVGLFQGRMFTANLCGSTSEALLARHPHLMNISCVSGLIGANDPVDLSSKHYVDAAVFADRVFVAQGAGNLGGGDSGQYPVLCPGYNAVCVSSYTSGGTYGPGNFGDDAPANRWRNNPATGREQPDLVGPAGGRLPDASSTSLHKGYASKGGTSFSTPFVLGTAALLMANYPQHLTGDPTLTRAVLMASARPLPGAPTAPRFDDDVDDRAGAGAPRGDRAREVLRDEQFLSRFVERGADFDDAGWLVATPPPFAVTAGDRVRVVLTYDQCQLNTTSSPDLLADLDLAVTLGSSPLGHTFFNSSHRDNTEIIDFTALFDGQVRVDVRAQTWDPCADGTRRTHMALAWYVTPGDIVVAP